jgi:hypothetical protein
MTSPPSRATERAHRESGQVPAEFMGLIVIVAGIVAVLVGAGLGGQISSDISAAVCRIGGGSCTIQQSRVSHVPTSECETMSQGAEVGADIVVFSVDVGGTAKYTLSRTVDKDGKEHWYVTLQGEGRIGADALIGEKAHLGDLGEGVSTEVKGLLKATGGIKYEFGDENSARGFITDAEHEAVKQGLLPSWQDPFGLGHKLMDTIDGHSFDPPPPKEIFLEGGGQIDGSADAVAGVVSGGLSATGSQVVGVKKTNTGNGPAYTVYTKISAEAGAKLGLFEAVEGEARAGGEVVVGVTYDDTGTPITSTLDVAGNLKGQLGGKAPLGPKSTLANVAGLTPEGTAKASDNLGGALTGKAQFRLDLTKGSNRDTFANYLHSVGVPVMLGDGTYRPPNPYEGVKGLYDAFDNGVDGTQLTVTTYVGESGGDKLAIKGGDVLTFGVEGGLIFENRDITGGYYYSPGNGFVQWAACSR